MVGVIPDGYSPAQSGIQEPPQRGLPVAGVDQPRHDPTVVAANSRPSSPAQPVSDGAVPLRVLVTVRRASSRDTDRKGLLVAASLNMVLRENAEPAQLIADGEIDIRTVGEFVNALDHATTRHDRLVVDLTRVSFLCTCGVEALDDHIGAVMVVLVSMGSPVARVLRMGGLERWIAHQPTTGIHSSGYLVGAPDR